MKSPFLESNAYFLAETFYPSSERRQFTMSSVDKNDLGLITQTQMKRYSFCPSEWEKEGESPKVRNFA